MGRIIAQAAPGLDALLNNAGTAFPAPLELIPLDALRSQMEVNVIGHMSVTQTLLPLLKAARGTIINVTSIGGRIGQEASELAQTLPGLLSQQGESRIPLPAWLEPYRESAMHSLRSYLESSAKELMPTLTPSEGTR